MAHSTPISLQFVLSSASTWVALSMLATLAIILNVYVRSRRLLIQLPGPPDGKWATGHFKRITGIDGIRFQENLVATYGPTMKLKGGFGEELLYTADPACMHAILVKDRAKFERAKGVTLMIRSVFGGGLLGLRGEEHRAHRKLLNPVFTMKFLRELMPIFMDIAKRTTEGIKNDLANNSSNKEVDVFPWATIAALELIGEAGLGYSFNSFTGARNEYNIAIKSVMQVFSKVFPFTSIMSYVYRIGTPSFRRWALRRIPYAPLQRLIYAVSIQNQQAEEVLRARQALLSSGGDLSSEAGRGRDIMTLLMKANEAEGSGTYIDRQELVGHMNAFVFAGHETTSTAISRLLHVLSNDMRVQIKLREEIRQYFEANSEDSHHDGLLELPYLDAVVREVLRLYEPVSMLGRMSEEDTILPLEYPIDTPTGKLTSIPIKKGTRILMSITTSNHYERIWGERAREFSPERWIGSKLEEVTNAGAHVPGVYSSMMTFGAGSYACIGFKFAVMEIKVVIAQLLNNFKFEPSEEEFVWELAGVQMPYSRKDLNAPIKLPKLMLKVTAL